MKRSMALGVVVWMFGAVAGWAAQPYPVVIEHNVPVRMRDGVTLRADIYRPDAPGKFPVLLERTPYNKANEIETGYLAARRGYVTVIEDCRGRYASEGEWYPFKHESQDGYDTVEWAASLPSSNGKVRRVLRGRYADAYRHRSPPPSCGNLSGRDGIELSRKLDIPGRSLHAVV